MITFMSLVIVGIALWIALRIFERDSLFQPSRDFETLPESVGLNAQELNIQTPDGAVLNAWYVCRDKNRHTLVLFHGNGGNISHRLQKILIFYQLELNIFLFDYRGYGKSTGKPSEEGLYLDAQSVVDYMRQILNVPEQKMIYYGESLGGAVAIDTATRIRPAAIILEGTFSNIHDMVAWFYPVIPSVLVRSKFDSLTKIKELDMPILMIHAQHDEVVPLRLGRKLFDAAPGPKDFFEIPGIHNEAFASSMPEIKTKIKEFLENNHVTS